MLFGLVLATAYPIPKHIPQRRMRRSLPFTFERRQQYTPLENEPVKREVYCDILRILCIFAEII